MTKACKDGKYLKRLKNMEEDPRYKMKGYVVKIYQLLNTDQLESSKSSSSSPVGSESSSPFTPLLPTQATPLTSGYVGIQANRLGTVPAFELESSKSSAHSPGSESSSPLTPLLPTQVSSPYTSLPYVQVVLPTTIIVVQQLATNDGDPAKFSELESNKSSAPPPGSESNSPLTLLLPTQVTPLTSGSIPIQANGLGTVPAFDSTHVTSLLKLEHNYALNKEKELSGGEVFSTSAMTPVGVNQLTDGVVQSTDEEMEIGEEISVDGSQMPHTSTGQCGNVGLETSFYPENGKFFTPSSDLPPFIKIDENSAPQGALPKLHGNQSLAEPVDSIFGDVTSSATIDQVGSDYYNEISYDLVSQSQLTVENQETTIKTRTPQIITCGNDSLERAIITPGLPNGKVDSAFGDVTSSATIDQAGSDYYNKIPYDQVCPLQLTVENQETTIKARTPQIITCANDSLERTVAIVDLPNWNGFDELMDDDEKILSPFLNAKKALSTKPDSLNKNI